MRRADIRLTPFPSRHLHPLAPPATILESARWRGEVAMGYRLAEQAGREEMSYGVRINPVKSVPIRFGTKDKIIVVAEG